MVGLDPHPSARMADFLGHLRRSGFRVGPAETVDALGFVAAREVPDAGTVRHGLKAMLSGDHGQWQQFDELFDAFWYGRGNRTVERAGDGGRGRGARRPDMWNRLLPPDGSGTGNAQAQAQAQAEDAAAEAAGEGTGRLVASRQDALRKVDLRRLVTPQDMAEAERLAERLARAIRFRLSRRRKPARAGERPDLRRIIRRSLSKGGEPFDLVFRKRPDRPVNLVLLLDVSGSMELYSRYLLAFVRGLLGAWLRADAYLFHMRLVHVSDALGDPDAMRSMSRLSLMTQGFGGGTRIAGSLRTFNDHHARRALDSRSVVVVLSDGYDTDPPAVLATELARLKRRARRLVWLNPLVGWRDYAPIAGGMAAAMPYVDLFAAAHTLDSLAALEPELARL